MPRYDRYRSSRASQNNSAANVVLPGHGRVIEIGPLRLTVKEAGERTRGVLALVELEASTTFHSPPPHVHRAHEEGFYVLDGTLEVTAGTEKVHATPGTFVMVPIGVPHTFGNATSGPVRSSAPSRRTTTCAISTRWRRSLRPARPIPKPWARSWRATPPRWLTSAESIQTRPRGFGGGAAACPRWLRPGASATQRDVAALATSRISS
jgi:mannose-6-phosphate isomerase-like protein (cupin superfamily)